jgi:hypothetical protein
MIKGTLWEGRNLYDLYGEAYTPWEWQPRLKQAANDLGLDLFSAPFDGSAVDFLEKMNVPAYKVASFENIDLPLLRIIASTANRSSCPPEWRRWPKSTKQSPRSAAVGGTNRTAQMHERLSCPARPMNLRTIPHSGAFACLSVYPIILWGSPSRWQRYRWVPVSLRSILSSRAQMGVRTAPFRWNRTSSNRWSKKCAPLRKHWGW